MVSDRITFTMVDKVGKNLESAKAHELPGNDRITKPVQQRI